MFTRGSFSKTGSGHGRRYRAQYKIHASRSGAKDSHQQEAEDMHGLETYGHARCKAARVFATKPDKGQNPRPSRRATIPHMHEHSSSIYAKGPGFILLGPLQGYGDALSLIKRLRRS